MRKVLFFALAVLALAFTACNPANEPELKGTVYHYRGTSYTEFAFDHDVYIALESNHKMTMKWVGFKTSETAEPVTLYLTNGVWEGDDGGYHIHCDGKPQLPDGKPFDQWESFDVDGGCDATSCSFDYHINGSTMGIFDGEIVND